MPIKSMLVPLGGADGDRRALDLALALARAAGAHVDALFVRRDPADALSYAGLGADPVGLQQIVDTVARDGAQASAETRRRFEDWRARNDVVELAQPVRAERASVAFHERVGAVRERIVEAGRAVDLMVLSHDLGRDMTPPVAIVEAAIFETGRPVLIAPAEPAAPPFATAVVAWNGSVEANHAVAAAMPLLGGCKQLFVFCQAEPHRAPVDSAPLLDYFAWHGIKADRLAVYQQHGSIGGDLLAAATRVGAGLLVMGGYTHGRLRQMVLGGVTSHVIRHAAIPVLLAH